MKHKRNKDAWIKLFQYQLTKWKPYIDQLWFAEKEFEGKHYGKDYIIKQNRKGEKAIFTNGGSRYEEQRPNDTIFLEEDEIIWEYRKLIKNMLGKKTLTRFGW